MLVQLVRNALRFMARRKGLAAVVLIILALGIGAITAVFSVLRVVLLQPLPYPSPEGLVVVWATHVDHGGAKEAITDRVFTDWRQRSESFEQMAGYRYSGLTLLAGGEPIEVLAIETSPELFPLLGARPVAGRLFSDDEVKPGGKKALLLSNSLWRNRFGGTVDIVGRQIPLEGDSYTVVGVLPPSFQFPDKEVGFYLPFIPNVENRARNLLVAGRLKQGVTLEQARAEMDLVSKNLAAESGDIYQGWSTQVILLQEQTVGDMKPVLMVLSGAVLAILLICCVNIANLLLALNVARQTEFSVRAALGAGQRQLFVQCLAESLLFALVGGTLGFVIAHWAVKALILLSPVPVPRVDDIRVDSHVFVFTLAVSLLAGIVIGFLPSLQALRSDLSTVLKGTRSSNEGGRTGARRILIALEVALTVMLLIGAGLMIRTIVRLNRTQLGWNPENVLAVQLYVPATKYSQPHQIPAFLDQLLTSLQELPEVRSAAATTALPGSQLGIDFSLPVFIDATSDGSLTAALRSVTPAYFSTLGIPLLQGRDFGRQDENGPGKALIVNQAFVQRFFPNEQTVVGRFVKIPFKGMTEYEIVGVVGDVRHDGLDREPRAEFYIPLQQNPFTGMGVVIRTAGDPAQLVEAFRAKLRAVDPEQPMSFVGPMEQLVAESLKSRRFVLIMLGIFASLSLMLTVTGIYGVMSFLVSLQTPEIGIRMALGAQRAEIFKSVVGQAAGVALFGLLLGLFGSVLSNRWIASFLYGISPTDPLVIVAGCLAVGLVAVLGAYVPARRATRIDPMVALRSE